MKISTLEHSFSDTAEPIKQYLEGKVVFDIGAGDGYFARKMAVYAKEVVAVEIDNLFASICHESGIKTINDDFENVELDCDVIYAFLSFVGNYMLTRKIERDGWHGTVISHFYPLGTDITNPMKPDETIHHNGLPFLIYHV